MNPEFIKWLEEQEYDFNYVDTINKPMERWGKSWFIKSVHDFVYPNVADEDYSYRWSQVSTDNFTETYDK